MKLNIVSRDFELTTYIERYVDNKLKHLLAWNWRQIQSIRVTLGDTNGPRGGIDKYCAITVDLETGHTIRVEKVARELYTAIANAADVAERCAQETIARQRSLTRRSGLVSMF